MAKRKTMTEAARGRLAKAEEHAAAEVESAAKPTVKATSGLSYVEVPIDAIAPNVGNVRKDLGDLSQLEASIKELGVLQPPVVRPLTDEERAEHPDAYGEGVRYVVVMGERRWTAAGNVGKESLPVLVRPTAEISDETEAMLVENLHRKQLSVVEEAKAYYELAQVQGKSQRAIAAVVGVTQAHVSRRLALLNLAPEVLELVEAGAVGVDVAAKDLAPLTHDDQRFAVEAARWSNPDGEYDADEIRSNIRTILAQRKREEQAIERARRLAEEHHARILTREELAAEFDEVSQRHVRTSDKAWQSAQEAGELGAVIEGGTLYWYALGEIPEPEQQAQEEVPEQERRSDPQAEEAARWRATKRDMAIWVEVNLTNRPRKTELLMPFVRHMIAISGKDAAAQVQKWLQGTGIGPEVEEYWQWKHQVLQEAKEADLLTIGWLLLIASDMYGSRYAGPDSLESQAVQQRLAEVRGETKEEGK